MFRMGRLSYPAIALCAAWRSGCLPLPCPTPCMSWPPLSGSGGCSSPGWCCGRQRLSRWRGLRGCGCGWRFSSGSSDGSGWR
ncbi:hypothetical protein AWT69_001184 [Pseudomonas putida]|nr:hypothetical protein AWT69_001184 [Pseudomonas putida]